LCRCPYRPLRERVSSSSEDHEIAQLSGKKVACSGEIVGASFFVRKSSMATAILAASVAFARACSGSAIPMSAKTFPLPSVT
jgi:hypothetical protein